MTIPRWFAAKTKAGQDHVAIEHLRRQNFEIYYPLIVVERINNRGRRIAKFEEGLFPGYVLIRFSLEISRWKVINSTRGISRLLSFAASGQPSAIPEGQIEEIQKQEKAGKLNISEVIPLKSGDQVRMKHWQQDMIGHVVRTRGERIEFLLNLLGRKIKCNAPIHALDIVSRARNASVR